MLKPCRYRLQEISNQNKVLASGAKLGGEGYWSSFATRYVSHLTVCFIAVQFHLSLFLS